MCESKVYVREGSELKLIAEDVMSMIPKENGYVLIDIAGRKYEVFDVVIEYIDFIQHKVVLKKVEH
ncbi:MAG: CooT family nickel-binding protein [Desulfurococcaceae archaeon]|jgi:predicted RNA-binding protein|nr:CooT family nickel-binding protein [Desulfurococcaceae archaeon]